MAPVDEIQKFLTQKTDYSYGVHLLSKVIKNTRIIHHLIRKESEVNWQKLIYELEKYMKSIPNPIENGKETEKPNQKNQTEPKRDELSSRPEIYTQQIERREKKELSTIPTPSDSNHVASSISNLFHLVKKKQALLYRSRGHLHGRLHEARTNEIRKQLASDIIKIQSDIEAVNKDLKLIEEGSIPRELVLKMMNAEQYKAYRNYQNYVVRYKNYLKKGNLSEEKKASYQAKLSEYETKIENFFTYG